MQQPDELSPKTAMFIMIIITLIIGSVLAFSITNYPTQTDTTPSLYAEPYNKPINNQTVVTLQNASQHEQQIVSTSINSGFGYNHKKMQTEQYKQMNNTIYKTTNPTEYWIMKPTPHTNNP